MCGQRCRCRDIVCTIIGTVTDTYSNANRETGFTSIVATSATNVWAEGGSAASARYFVYHFDGVRGTGVPGTGGLDGGDIELFTP